MNAGKAERSNKVAVKTIEEAQEDGVQTGFEKLTSSLGFLD
jgi:hypothetical protein